MPHRYFTTEISDGTATLRGADAHHLARVMRARLGDTVILCDGNAVEYTATITGFGDECVEFRVEPGYPSAAEPSVEVTLLAGYPKQDKLEQIIKHGVELGAAHIVPFFSRYCVAAPKKEEQKNERYNRIAVEAAKQCGRGILPDVALPLANFGAVCRTFAQYDLVLFCYECGGAPLRDLLAAAKPADGEKLKIAIVTGAEGGFAAEEAEMAAKAGARTVGLGPRILRCETAPLAVLASVMTDGESGIMLCAARQRLRAFRTATRGRSFSGAAPCFLLFRCADAGRSVNETLVLCILPGKADAQLADREARMELVVVLIELHQLLLHHPVCSLLGIGVGGVNVRIQVLIGHVLRLRLACTLPDQLCQLDAVRRQGEALHVHQTVDAGAGLIGTQDYSAADDDTGQDGVHGAHRVHRVYRVHRRLHGVHGFVHGSDRHVAFGHFKVRRGMVLLIGEAQQVIHFILYNAVQDHDPGPACELLSIGGWVCGQGDRGAFVDLVIGVNLSVNAPDLDRCRGILGGQGVAGCVGSGNNSAVPCHTPRGSSRSGP